MEDQVMTEFEPMEQTSPEQAQDASSTPVAEDGSASFSDFLSGDTEGTAVSEEPVEQEAPQTPREPGYVKKRLDKQAAQYTAQIDELNERIASYDKEIARLSEYYYQQQANELVKSGKVRDPEIALAYVKSQAGLEPKQEQVTPQMRDENGRFTSGENAEIRAQAQSLYNEAMTIQNVTGVDVMAVYNNDPEVRDNVLSGKWTFKDVYDSVVVQKPDGSSKRVPSAVRSSNGVDLQSVNVRRMSNSEYRKLDDFLAKGGKVDMRR